MNYEPTKKWPGKLKIGDCVIYRGHRWSRGFGLIIDKNPTYWFVQFAQTGEMLAIKSHDLRLISG